jgi:hypothetical protein
VCLCVENGIKQREFLGSINRRKHPNKKNDEIHKGEVRRSKKKKKTENEHSLK